jgi:hypothetical protein
MAPRQPNLSREAAARRNLQRLAALAEAPPGLVVATVASSAIGAAQGGASSTAFDRSGWAALAELPGMAVWAWPSHTAPEAIAGDLTAARAALGEDTRAVLVLRPRARVLSAPLHGEVGVEVEGVDAVPLIRAAGGLDEGELVRGVDVPWSEDAEAHVAAGGFRAQESRD